MTDNDKSATSVDKQVERWLLQRYSQNRQTRNIAMSLTIPGDHNRTIGEIVGIKLPSNYYPKEEHTFYTGNYLITEVITSQAIAFSFPITPNFSVVLPLILI